MESDIPWKIIAQDIWVAMLMPEEKWHQYKDYYQRLRGAVHSDTNLIHQKSIMIIKFVQ